MRKIIATIVGIIVAVILWTMAYVAIVQGREALAISWIFNMGFITWLSSMIGLVAYQAITGTLEGK